MIDRFGNLPVEAEHLLSIVKLKQLAKSVNISRIDQGEKGLLLTFRNKSPKSPEAVIKLVEQYRGVIKIRPDEKLFVAQIYYDEQEKIKQIEKILIALSSV
jgi:transcription-repair coupling factor (superfamily II helicase)